MKIFTSILVGLSLAASVFGQALPPVLRNGLTTNTFLPAPGSIPAGSAIVWDGTNNRWTNGIASANATNAISNSVGDGTNTSFWVSGPGYAVRISGPLLAGTNGPVTFGHSVNFSSFTNWNVTYQNGSWTMNVSGQFVYVRDGAAMDVENGSVILIGANPGAAEAASSLRLGTNAYIYSGSVDNNEINRYRLRNDITGNVTNWMMRYWEMSNYVASFLTNTTGSGATFVLQGSPTLSNTVTFVGTVGVQQPQIKLMNTVGNGYLAFSQPGGWIPTNNISFKFTNVQAGQIVGIASAVISAGIVQIDLTNVNASAGGGAGLSTNANQFLGDPLAIKDSALLSNIFNYGAITLPTAGKFHMFAGVVSNGWYNVSSVANQTIGHLNGTNQYYRVTLTSNTNLVLTNIQDNIWYTVELTNSGAFTATIFPISTANWVQHPFSSPVITQNGVTLWRFMKTGTSTNAYEDGAQLELAKGPGIQFATNGSGILTISVIGAAAQFSPASANGDPLVIVSNAFLTNVTLFGMTVLDQNGVGDYGFDISAIKRFYLFDGVNNVLIYDTTRGLYAPAGYGNTNGYKDFPWFKSFNVDVFAASNIFAQFVWPTNVGASKIVRTDSSGKLSDATIGSGISFDGTTISATATGGTNFDSIRVTNQILYVAQKFNGSNGVTATALTNIWDMSLNTFKPVTNFVGTNLTFILSNITESASLISELIGLPGTTNKVYVQAISGVNLKWKGWDTNASMAGIAIRGGYSYTIQAFANSTTNVSVWVTTDEPAPPITITTNDIVINTRYTNTSQRLTYVQCSMTLNAGVTDIAQAVLLIDQNADGTFDTWITNRIGSGVAMADSILVGGWVTNGGIYMITNQSTGSATATINPNSSQVVSGFGAVNISGVTSGGGIATNANQFLGDPLSVIDGALFTNPVVYTSIVLRAASAAGSVAPGLTMSNTAAATSGNQRSSPGLRFAGNGFNSVGSTSSPVEMEFSLLPVQANPVSSILILSNRVGGAGAWTAPLQVSSSGFMTLQSSLSLVGAVGNIQIPPASVLQFNGRGVFSANSDGVLALQNNAQTDFVRFQFGGTTAAFPALARTNGHLRVTGGTGLLGSAATNAMYIDGGTYYVSNTIIPSVTQLLGAGGYWVGNSNGFLVTVYTLDGSTTAMKVLAP